MHELIFQFVSSMTKTLTASILQYNKASEIFSAVCHPAAPASTGYPFLEIIYFFKKKKKKNKNNDLIIGFLEKQPSRQTFERCFNPA